MGGLTLAQAEQHLTEARNSLSAALISQSYSVPSRSSARPNLSEILATIKFLEDRIAKLERQSQTGGIRHRAGVAL